MIYRKQWVLALVAGVALSACSSDRTQDGQPDVPVVAPPTAVQQALFRPAGGILPYPNDLYFNGSTDGTLNLPPTAFNPLVESLNRLDGYSTTASATVRFSQPLDPATLIAGQTVIVLEVVADPQLGFAPVGVVGPLVPGVDYTVGIADTVDSDDSTLEITPLVPLNEKSAYLVFVTDGVSSASGSPAGADEDYAAIKQAIATGGSTGNATLDQIAPLIGAHLQIGSAIGLDPADVIVSFSFSTQSISDVMEAVDSITGPQLIVAQFTGVNSAQVNPLLSGSANVYAGALTVPYYLNPAAPLEGFWEGGPSPLDPSSNALTRYNPVPVAKAELSIPLLLTAPGPQSAYVQAGGTEPPDGWPVVVFQHGITGDRTNLLAIADAFADAGWVVVGIDQPLHGLTPENPAYALLGQDGSGPLGTAERTFDLDLVDNATGAPGPDGRVDPSGTHYINLPSPLTSRDNLRQSAADLITLTRSLGGLDFDADGQPDIDTTRIAFAGLSLGAMVGTTALAVNDDIGPALLSTPGGKITELLLDSPTFRPRIVGGLQAAGLIEGTTLFAQYIRDTQTIIDSGDPVNHGAAAAAGHPILMHEVVGGGANPPDQVVPNSATDLLANVMDLPVISAPGVNSGPLGLVRFTAGSHASLLDPSSSFAATVEMQTQAVVFIAGNALAGLPGGGQVILISDPTVVETP
jgi:hypothetical protein